MRKYLQISIVVLIILLAAYFKNTPDVVDDEKINVQVPTPTTVTTVAVSPTAQVSSSKYRDGVYDGSIEDAVYGDLQVEVVIAGGRITDVSELMYPDDNHTSIAINKQALIILRQEAIDKHSFDVDIVTGASDSAPAFARSLRTALVKAK